MNSAAPAPGKGRFEAAAARRQSEPFCPGCCCHVTQAATDRITPLVCEEEDRTTRTRPWCRHAKPCASRLAHLASSGPCRPTARLRPQPPRKRHRIASLATRDFVPAACPG